VEAGSGVSTIITALAVKKYGGGTTFALENGAAFAEETRSHVRQHGIEDYAEIIHAPLKRYTQEGEEWQWYDIASLNVSGPIDLLIVDGPPAVQNPYARFPALPILWERLSSDMVVLVDDGDRKEEKEIVERWCEKYNLESTYLNLEKGAYLLRQKFH
jgi:hypothetical protein